MKLNEPHLEVADPLRRDTALEWFLFRCAMRDCGGQVGEQVPHRQDIGHWPHLAPKTAQCDSAMFQSDAKQKHMPRQRDMRRAPIEADQDTPRDELQTPNRAVFTSSFELHPSNSAPTLPTLRDTLRPKLLSRKLSVAHTPI